MSYSISPALAFVSLNSILKTISVISSSVTDVGFYSLSLMAKLDAYPLNTQTMPFTMTINPCIVTSVVPSSNAFDPI